MTNKDKLKLYERALVLLTDGNVRTLLDTLKLVVKCETQETGCFDYVSLYEKEMEKSI